MKAGVLRITVYCRLTSHTSNRSLKINHNFADCPSQISSIKLSTASSAAEKSQAASHLTLKNRYIMLINSTLKYATDQAKTPLLPTDTRKLKAQTGRKNCCFKRCWWIASHNLQTEYLAPIPYTYMGNTTQTQALVAMCLTSIQAWLPLPLSYFLYN